MTELPFRDQDTTKAAPTNWRVRLALVGLSVIACATIWVTHSYLTDRFTQNTRNRAELRMALYSGNLQSELRRNAIVPQLLSKDPALIAALVSSDFRNPPLV